MSIHVVCSIHVHVRSLADMTGSHSVTHTAASSNLSWSQLHFLSQTGRPHWEWMGTTAFPPPRWIWSEPDLVKQSEDRKARVGQYLNCCLTNLHPLLMFVGNVSYLTLFPVPLPTGGWHSAACRTVHSMISIKAVSCLSVRAAQQKTVSFCSLPHISTTE